MRGFLILIIFVSQILGLQVASAKYSWGGAKKIKITHSHTHNDSHDHHTDQKSDSESKGSSKHDPKGSHSHELTLEGSGIQFLQNEIQLGMQKIDSPKQIPFKSSFHESPLIGSLFRPPISAAKIS